MAGISTEVLVGTKEYAGELMRAASWQERSLTIFYHTDHGRQYIILPFWGSLPTRRHTCRHGSIEERFGDSPWKTYSPS